MANGGRASAGTGTRTWTIFRDSLGGLTGSWLVAPENVREVAEAYGREAVTVVALDDAIAALRKRWPVEPPASAYFEHPADFLAELFKEGSTMAEQVPFQKEDARLRSTPRSAGVSSERRDDGLNHVALMLCDQCLDGAGGECHTPGCALWLNRAPDLPFRDKAEAVLRAAESPALEEAVKALEEVGGILTAQRSAEDRILDALPVIERELAALRQPDGGNDDG